MSDDHARIRSRQVAQRLKDDASFRQQVEADPINALREAGVPDQALADFVREVGIEADVAGYRAYEAVCKNEWTCVSSCWISTW